VARQLRLKEGTVWSRLSKARRYLQERLARRGVALSAALGALGLARDTAKAAVPAFLVKCTTKAAVSFAASRAVADLVSAKVAVLTNAVMHTMSSTNSILPPSFWCWGLSLAQAASWLIARLRNEPARRRMHRRRPPR